MTIYYTIKDGEGGGLKENRVFASRAEIVVELADFHSIDYTGEGYDTIYDFLNTLKDDKEQMDWLADYGNWEIEEHTIKPERCHAQVKEDYCENLAFGGEQYCDYHKEIFS